MLGAAHTVITPGPPPLHRQETRVTRLHLYELRTATFPSDRAAYHSIRKSVLFDARGRTGYDENYPDETNPANLPMVLMRGGTAVCAFRLDRGPSNVGIIRLMAVAPGEQRKGHGRAAIALLVDFARGLNLKALEVGSARDAVEFYLRQGFVLVDPAREAPLLRLDFDQSQ